MWQVRFKFLTLLINAISEQQGSVINGEGRRAILLICEHASNFIPASFNGLGLNEQQLKSHITWNLGALETAEIMAQRSDFTRAASDQ